MRGAILLIMGLVVGSGAGVWVGPKLSKPAACPQLATTIRIEAGGKITVGPNPGDTLKWHFSNSDAYVKFPHTTPCSDSNSGDPIKSCLVKNSLTPGTYLYGCYQDNSNNPLFCPDPGISYGNYGIEQTARANAKAAPKVQSKVSDSTVPQVTTVFCDGSNTGSADPVKYAHTGDTLEWYPDPAQGNDGTFTVTNFKPSNPCDNGNSTLYNKDNPVCMLTGAKNTYTYDVTVGKTPQCNTGTATGTIVIQ